MAIVTVGVSESNHGFLKKLGENEFPQMVDAYRFAACLAIAQDSPADKVEGWKTVFNVGTVDPTGELRSMIEVLYPDESDAYGLFERLADWGLSEMKHHEEAGSLAIESIIKPFLGEG